MPAADPLNELVYHLGKLPGIGERTATRLALFLLQADEAYPRALAQSILQLKERLHSCRVCGMFTETEPCAVCGDGRRDATLILVVASPQDVMAIERTGGYRGRYHVLHGLLSPLDGIGPNELHIRQLLARLGPGNAVEEVILATSPSVEGDATALYLGNVLRPLGLKVSRIASGVPIGGELEYTDGVTLHRAIEERRVLVG